MPIYRVTFKDGKQETVSADTPEQARRRIMEIRRNVIRRGGDIYEKTTSPGGYKGYTKVTDIEKIGQ